MCFSSRVCWTLVLLVNFVMTPEAQEKRTKEILLGIVVREHAVESEQMKMMDFAVRRVNAQSDSFVPGHLMRTVTVVIPDRVPDGSGETLHLLRAFCRLADHGIIALFELIDYSHAVRGDDASKFLAHLADSIHLPYILWRSGMSLSEQYKLAVNVHPSVRALNRAMRDMTIQHLTWQDFTFIYSSGASMIRTRQVMRDPTDKSIGIRFRRYDPKNVYDLLMDMDRHGWRHIVVDLNRTTTRDFLQAALNKGMINRNYHFVLTSLDVTSSEYFEGEDLLDNFRHNCVNISAYTLPIRNHTFVKDTLRAWGEEAGFDSAILPSLHSALLHDAIWTLAIAIRSFGRAPVPWIAYRNSCSNPGAKFFLSGRRSPDGVTLRNYLNSVQWNYSLTGPLLFRDGERQSFSLNLKEMTPLGMYTIGNWSSSDGLRVTGLPEKLAEEIKRRLQPVAPLRRNNTLKVVTILQAPFVMKKKKKLDKNNPEPLFGHDQYEGFCISMMKVIAERLKLDWEIRVLENGTYGALVTNTVTKKPEWTGMMKELIDGRAHIALGAFTISYLREKYVDFTKPFMSLGISILFKKPVGEKPGLFSFLRPLALEIWVYLVASYLVVTLSIYAMARFTPYEWQDPHPCSTCEESGYLQTSFTLANSFWFTFGTLTQQGSDINPRALSTRLVGGVWWFFTLIIISSYTANLAAFLTVEQHVSLIENVEDLVKQDKIHFGALDGGSTMSFFQNSTLGTYRKVWNFMKEHRKSVMMKSTLEGVKRVKRSNYAYLMESAMIEYYMSRDRECELDQVGGLIDSKGYGIGVAPGLDHLRDQITLQILEMQRDQLLQKLKNKWWREGTTCTLDSHRRGQDVQPQSLDLHGVGGIFMSLGAGLVLAVVVACVEFTWHTRQKDPTAKYMAGRRTTRHEVLQLPRQPLCSAMGRELRFACNCYGSSRRRLSQIENSVTTAVASPPNSLPRNGEFRRYSTRLAERSPILEYKTICTETVT